MDNITVKITTKHFKESDGYIFDNCPLKLALTEMFPAYYILIGSPKVLIIHNKKEDKDGLIYLFDNQCYHPIIVDRYVSDCKAGGHHELVVPLEFSKLVDNAFKYTPKEDHVVEKPPQELPKDLFSV